VEYELSKARVEFKNVSAIASPFIFYIFKYLYLYCVEIVDNGGI
jgi:hypothetical protein